MEHTESIIPEKEGIVEVEDEEGVTLYVRGSRYIARVASTLGSETRARIIELLFEGPRDLDDIAAELRQSKANISNQVKRLEDLGLVSSSYHAGERGVRKVVKPRVRRVVIELAPPSRQYSPQ
ncbi:MAG: transcriptional regulator [Acidilobaceae archaeon]